MPIGAGHLEDPEWLKHLEREIKSDHKKLSLEKEIERNNRRIGVVALAFFLWIGYEVINAPPHNVLPSIMYPKGEGLKEPYNCREQYKKGEPCLTNRFSLLSLLYK